ncbi:MAG: IclR family transcriptional regulator [Bryobacteraceae bacterium]
MAQLKTPSVPALERALSILELLARSSNGLSLPELARRLKLPKSSVHCLLLTLERRKYLQRNDNTHRYLFGNRLFGLANMALSGTGLRERAAPFLRALMERTGLTVHAAILERNEAVLVAKAEPAGIFRLATWIGKRMDAHCTGVGKALIAYLPDSELSLLIAERGLPRHNDNTISSVRKLKEELARVRKLGYSTEDEEDEVGLRCIGAPVFDRAGSLAAAISVAGTTSQISVENMGALARQLKQAADAISSALGFQPKTVR